MLHVLTLWPVAGLGVAALHCGGFGVGVTLAHRVQVPLSVWADHLPLAWAGATTLSALEEKRREIITNINCTNKVEWPCVVCVCCPRSPVPSLRRASWSVSGRPPSHRVGRQSGGADGCRTLHLAAFLLNQCRWSPWSVHLHRRSLSTADTTAQILGVGENRFSKKNRDSMFPIFLLKSI